MGRIIVLHPGKDQLIRVVSIKTKNKIIKRPITKISRLISSSNTDSTSIKEKSTMPQACLQAKSDNTRPKRTRDRKTYGLITLAVLLLVSIISPAQCIYNLRTLNTNHSIYLDKISNIQLIKDQWKLIVYYDMDPYQQGLYLFKKHIKNLEDICYCMKATKQTRCNAVLLQLNHEAAELEYYNGMLRGQHLTRSTRPRRGLINGVGYIAHSLFGVLDESFAEQYQKDINLIRSNQNHLVLLWKNQTSIVEAEHNLLKRIEESMDKQHKLFNQHIIDLEKANNEAIQKINNIEETNDFFMAFIITNNILGSLKNIRETLVETITNVHNGKLNVHLLTPEQLREELSIISGQLPRDLALPIDNMQTNFASIYQLLEVKMRMTDKFFIFEIKIPLVSSRVGRFFFFKMLSGTALIWCQMDLK